jgi:hypothetical protein
MRFVDDGLLGGRSGEEDPFADPSKVVIEEVVDVEKAMSPNEGDVVRVVSSEPIVHSHVAGYDEGLCSVGLVGRVTRVLNQRAFPKNVVVEFDLEGGTKFEAHFYPGQVRREG